jgi:hypothetical protein
MKIIKEDREKEAKIERTKLNKIEIDYKETIYCLNDNV